MAESVIMERGYAYHANFIYNRPKLRYQSNEDCDTSLEIVKFAVDMMARWGYDRTYYHDRDALPGGNVFDEFFKTVKLSRFTVVIVTKGFVNDSWGKYKSQAAFSKLLEKERSNRFIAFYINIDKHDIPDELCIKEALELGDNWSNSQEWNKLKKLLSPVSRPVQDMGPDLYPQTYNLEQHNTVVTSRQNYSGNQIMTSTSRQGAQDGRQSSTNFRVPENQRNPTINMQDTSPPDPTMLRGHDLATDSSDTPTQSLDQVSQQGEDNSQSLGFSVNSGQNRDTHNENTDLVYQRESVSAGISGSSNNSTTTQLGGIDRTSGVAMSLPSNTADVNNRTRSAQVIRSSPRDEVDNETSFPLEAPGRSEDMAETSTRTPQEHRSTQRSSQDVAQTSRSPPDGEANQNNQNSVDVQREDSTDTNPKGLVGGDDENSMSSLDQPDVEVDTEQTLVQIQSQNIKHSKTCTWSNDDIPSDQQSTQLVRPKEEFLNQQWSASGLDSVPRLEPTTMQDVKRTCSNDIRSIDCRRDGYRSSPQVSANNNSDDASLHSRMYSLVTDNRFKFAVNTFTTITNAITKCDQI